MSSSVLDNKISNSILFSHEPFFPLPLNFFGSTCFVHNFSLSLDKLSPRLHKCVFLGFTRSQKGYKCLSPSVDRYFISTDVTFNESSLYFKQLLLYFLWVIYLWLPWLIDLRSYPMVSESWLKSILAKFVVQWVYCSTCY